MRISGGLVTYEIYVWLIVDHAWFSVSPRRIRRLAILVQSKAMLTSAGVHRKRYERARDNKPGNIAKVLPSVVATPRVEALGAPFFEIHTDLL